MLSAHCTISVRGVLGGAGLTFALFHQPSLQYLLNGLEDVSVGINISILSKMGLKVIDTWVLSMLAEAMTSSLHLGFL